jgi:hypothetical protein
MKYMQSEPVTSWSLTLVVSGERGLGNNLEHSLFVFGRDKMEMNQGQSMRLPSAIIELLKKNRGKECCAPEAADDDEAMEMGFLLELTSIKPPSSMDWAEMQLLLEYDCDNPFNRHGLYAPNNTLTTAEMFCLNPFSSSLPRRVWMRAKTLPERTIAWLLDEGLLGSDSGIVSTLHDFGDLNIGPPTEAKMLPLPGPPIHPYEFLPD